MRRHGDEIEVRELDEIEGAGDDVVVMIGNKIQLDLPVPVVRLDKSYPFETLRRDHEHSRVSINIPHPTPYLGRLRSPADRRRLFRWEVPRWCRDGRRVLVFGGSQSFYERLGVADVQAHLQDLVDRVRAASQLPVAFRAKPNMARHLQPMRSAEAVDPFGFLRPILADVRCIVVEESAAAVEALLCGVPAVVLGEAPTKNISSQDLAEVDRPRLAAANEVEALLNDLAYFNYSLAEHESGVTWEFLRRLI